VARLEAEVLALRGPHAGWNSAIVPDFPKLFEDFEKKQCTHLWRGTCGRFYADEFHSRSTVLKRATRV
jgi:hypothetical protein